MTVDRSFVPIAEVVRAVGLKGECRLYPLLDWYPPLLEGSFLIWEGGEAAAVDRQRQTAHGPVVGFAGCWERQGAEALVGRRLGFRRESYLEPSFPRPPDGLPFRFLGREVTLASGRLVGSVVEVRRYPAQIILVIDRQGREVLIPAVAPILRRDAGLVGPLVIDPPEGLLDGAGD